MHLGMSGWFRVEPTEQVQRWARDLNADLENRHDHVIVAMSSGTTVIFNDPRRRDHRRSLVRYPLSMFDNA